MSDRPGPSHRAQQNQKEMSKRSHRPNGDSLGDSFMPFRESKLTGAPGEGWLRRIFIEDWGLKLLALAITLVLWFVVSGRDIQRELAVEPHYDGKPAPTCEVKEVSATPAKVRVTGPAGHVNALEKAPTE